MVFIPSFVADLGSSVMMGAAEHVFYQQQESNGLANTVKRSNSTTVSISLCHTGERGVEELMMILCTSTSSLYMNQSKH